jgi:hypothetical protein
VLGKKKIWLKFNMVQIIVLFGKMLKISPKNTQRINFLAFSSSYFFIFCSSKNNLRRKIILLLLLLLLLTFFCSSITKPLVGSVGFIRAFFKTKFEKKVGTYNLREALNFF